MSFSAGEMVTRKSHKHDLLFRIASISGNSALLHGEDFRLVADASLDDLEHVGKRDLEQRKKQRKEQEEFSYRLFRQDYQLMKEKREYQTTNGYQYTESFFQLPTKVLHIDGDRMYLRKCIELYSRIGLQVHGVHIHEKDMPHEIGSLVEKIQPNIVVITGHDAYSRNKGMKKDIRAYRNSKYFCRNRQGYPGDKPESG